MSSHAYAEIQGASFLVVGSSLLDRYLYRGSRRKPRGIKRFLLFLEYVWNLNW